MTGDTALVLLVLVVAAVAIVALRLLRRSDSAVTSAQGAPPHVETGVASKDDGQLLAVLLINGDIFWDPALERREKFPFTNDNAMKFFAEFGDARIVFPRRIGSIFLHTAKEALPRHSIAAGFLFAENADEISAAGGGLPKPIGSVTFEYGGHVTKPTIRVEPMSS